MNENNPNLPEYVKTLPKVLQDLIFNWPWEERVGEIAKKYSLNYNQTESLINKVLFILIGLDKPETLQQTLAVELKISKLLTDQIINDLETRIFEYAIKEIESKKSKVESGENQNKPKILEVKPNNLPMVEKGETTFPPSPRRRLGDQSAIGLEPVQRPVSVPRYDMKSEQSVASSKDEPSPRQSVSSPRQSATIAIIEDKLKNVTSETPEKTSPAPDSPKKYVVDP